MLYYNHFCCLAALVHFLLAWQVNLASTPYQEVVVEKEKSTVSAYFIDPINGQDPTTTVPRSGTIDEPWKTLAFGLSSSSPLAAGDTLYLRAGRYFETRIHVYKSGEPGQAITIRNYKDEEVVLDGSIKELSESTAWEAVDEDKGIYRSVDPFPVPCPLTSGPASSAVTGLFEVGLDTFALLVYRNKFYLFSNNEYWDDSLGYYAGPGLYYDYDSLSSDFQHIFLRLKAPDPAVVGGVQNTFDALGRVFQPSEVKLHIAHATGALCMTFLLRGGASYLHWEGFSIFNPGMATVRNFDTRIQGVQFRNIKIAAAASGFVFSGGENSISKDIVFDHITFSSYRPPWNAWTDSKGAVGADGQPVASVAVRAINLLAGTQDVLIRNCYFYDTFDGMIIQGVPGNNIHDVKVVNCVMDNIIDDAITLGSDVYDVEITANRLLNIGSGVSYQGSGQPDDPENIGKVYIHHNLIIGAPQPTQRAISEALPATFRTLSPLATTHSSGQIGISPRKIYHNTVITKDWFRGNQADTHTKWTMPVYQGVQEPIYPENADVIPTQSLEVYNNIFMIEADVPIGERQRVHTGREIYDGNIYWRMADSIKKHLFLFYDELIPANAMDYRLYHSIDEFKGEESWYALTQAYYSPGWENSGRVTNPLLADNYFPDPEGPAAGGGIDLEGRGWPGLDGLDYRGAFPAEQIVSIGPERQSNNPGLVVIPNPTDGQFKIHYSQQAIASQGVDIYDNAGRRVLSNLSPSATKNFDISFLPTGVYYIQVWDENKIKVTKVVKK